MAAKNGCDGRLIAKILITTIQVNLVPNCSETWRGNTNSAELSLLKFLLLAYHHSHSWPPPSLFTGLLGATHFFYSWAVFGLHCNYWNFNEQCKMPVIIIDVGSNMFRILCSFVYTLPYKGPTITKTLVLSVPQSFCSEWVHRWDLGCATKHSYFHTSFDKHETGRWAPS